MDTAAPVLPAMNTVMPLSVGILVNQQWSVVLSVNHTASLTCVVIYEFYFCYKEDNNTEQFLSYFWLFTSDFKYPLTFFSLR